MDTLCIPVQEDLDDLRKLCISKMRYIYSAANAVLVLESSMQSMPSTTSIVDKNLKIYTSKWLHRLWTYQEGALAKQLFFQFEDTSEEIQEILDEEPTSPQS